jgi:transcriptional regulator with XRE-family HTH domain
VLILVNTKVATFAERLNYLISQSGKSSNRIAGELGVTRSAISSWQNSVREPRRPTLEIIARYFNVDISWLMGYDTEMRPTADVENKASDKPEPQAEEIVILARAARHMSEEDRKTMLDMAKLMFKKAFQEADKEK